MLSLSKIKSEKGFSLVEIGIVIGLVAITTLAVLRLSSFMIQANNGLTYRMQRLELDRNLRHIFFNGDHCDCTFRGIQTPFQNSYDVSAREFVVRQDPTNCQSQVIQTLLSQNNTPLIPRATAIRITDINILGNPANVRKAMARLEYTVESPKEILGPKSYTTSILFTLNLQDAGGGVFTIGSCGKQPPDDIIANPAPRGIPMDNAEPPIPLQRSIGGGDTGYYLAQLDVRGNNPTVKFYAPPISANSVPIDTYNFSTGVDGRIQNKSALVLLPIFNGNFYYKQSNGNNRTELTPLVRVPLPYSPLTPAVQFADYKGPIFTNPAIPNIPVTISQPNPGEDTIIRYSVRPVSAEIRTNAIQGADYTLPADTTLTFPMNTAILSQNIPLQPIYDGSGQNKTVIIRINVISGGILNYPNEYIARFRK